MKIIDVNLPQAAETNYNIFIKNGLLSEFSGYLEVFLKKKSKIKTFAIITDKNVFALYEKIVAETLIHAGFNVISFSIEPGEKSKSAAQYFVLQSWLAENQITRSDALIALGGGVVGDLTGFTAATYLRGVQFIQIPTTLLAMVDSSVGGKTGIDIPQGKNLVGAFYQPSMVLCDPQVLETLSSEVFSDGCAEIVKHGMIRGADLLKTLQSSPIRKNLPGIIEANVKIKRDIVQKDEFDTGERQLLNFGHTIAHAVEKLSGYEVSHGNAVAIGMSIITRAAVRNGCCSPKCQTVLKEMLETFGLPSQTKYSPSELYKTALIDKKRTGDTITEVIPRGFGVCELKKMPVTELLEWIEWGV